MSKQTEALKLALEAFKQIDEAMPFPVAKLAQKAIREALALPVATNDTSQERVDETSKQRHEQEPEFVTHAVENAEDWSEWVCPDPKSYLMKCCDCGLVHEAEFGVVRYKSETEREDCDMVDDPNLQVVFRMRRTEQWLPSDTAHRSGGLAQPEQCECPACKVTPHASDCAVHNEPAYPKGACNCGAQPEQEPVAYSYTSRITGAQGFSHHPMPRFIDAESWDIKPLYTTPPQRKPLTMQERTSIVRANKSFHDKNEIDAYGVIDDVEAAHGITGESK